MTTRMLIDATHAEETRVVVVRGNKLEEFDFESSTKKQLKGNIYLAKVTRVEPALQAAFVEYGGNRHGFLAFSEIHPDYYQIPVEDRQALIEQEAAEEAELEAAAHADERRAKSAAPAEAEGEGEGVAEGGEPEADAGVEIVGAHDEIDEEVTHRRAQRSRRYKIQEVVRRRQILLIQVVKEERGNKGAAVTTYLSLAGRFCVLMPNTARGGGISRKIANPKDRKRLKGMVEGLEVPDGMGVIIRTAGMEQTKREIKRDFDYLMRQWDNVRDLTLKSTAPALIYEEGNLIKRSIRDLYTKDIDEILVEGDEGYRTAKEFMRMLMPSQAKAVQPYKERISLFPRYQVESQLDTMFSPVVHLKSGGYIVINVTEALVAIDVNSGRATREHNIEETALKTNLEASDEVARQLRLRDLAGLIVIDYIDMERHQNNRSVERRLKERLKHDRARIQVGRISAFGLLEMSRQRLRPGLLEASTQMCDHCAGTGIVRSTESSALHVLRAIEEEGIRERSEALTVHTTPDVMSYILNQKRVSLNEISARYRMTIHILPDEHLIAPNFNMERADRRAEATDVQAVVPLDESAAAPAAQAEAETPPDATAEEPRKGRRRRRGRRRRGRGPFPGEEQTAQALEATSKDGPESEEEAPAETATAAETGTADASSEAAEPKEESGRRRRRRGSRNRREEAHATAGDEATTTDAEAAPTVAEVREPEESEAPAPAPAPIDAAETAPAEQAANEVASEEEKPKSRARTRRRRTPKAEASAEVSSAPTEAPAAEPTAEEPPAEARTERAAEPKPQAAEDEAPIQNPDEPEPQFNGETAAPEKEPEPADPQHPALAEAKPPAEPKRGWWQRRARP